MVQYDTMEKLDGLMVLKGFFMFWKEPDAVWKLNGVWLQFPKITSEINSVYIQPRKK